MKNPIVELVAMEMAWFEQLWERQTAPNLQIFPEQDNLYPIPFFGDVRRAEVLTLALNPSHREFSHGRWPSRSGPRVLTADGLTNRLLSYFHLPQFKQHPWFDECEKGLLALDCSYERNAAHIDVHPFPTKFANQLNREETVAVAEVIRSQSAEHLVSVLKLCERVKLIFVVEYSVPLGGSTFEFVRDRLSPLAGLVDAAGVEPPVVRGGDHKNIANFIFVHRSRLRSFLLNAPSLIF